MTFFLPPRVLFVPLVFAMIACGGGSGGGTPDAGTKYQLSMNLAGTGSGRVTSNPPATIDCTATCSASLDAGSSVTLTAAPAAGSEFIGWSGACSGTGMCTISMDAAKAVTARFSMARIVFHSARKIDGTDALNANGTTNIWRVNWDATGLTALTAATANQAGSYFAAWSPDGSKVVFRSMRKLDGSDAPNVNGVTNIWRVNVDGTGLMPLTTVTAVGADGFQPQWSPDGTAIIFESGRKLDGTDAAGPNRTLNIWRVNADGTGLRLVTNITAAQADSIGPRWSPDGTKVVFYSWRKLDGTDAMSPNRVLNIWRVNADSTAPMPLTTTVANGTGSSNPQWSPDGTKVVFDSSRSLDGTDAPNTNGTQNIWRVNADGTGLRLITNTTALDANNIMPQWSPDGTQVVFSSSRKLDGSDAPNANTTFNIWRINADGTGLTPLTRGTVSGISSFNPQWSPGGTKVVFYSARKLDGTDAANVNLTINIWRVNADGTSLTPLTSVTANMAHCLVPSFGP